MRCVGYEFRFDPLQNILWWSMEETVLGKQAVYLGKASRQEQSGCSGRLHGDHYHYVLMQTTRKTFP